MTDSITDIEKKEGRFLRLSNVPAYILKISGVVVKRRVINDWVNKGKRCYTGRLIKLRAINSCGLWLTTTVWVEEFLRKLNM